MKFEITINYEDKDTGSEKDFELSVSSKFCDESAKLVTEVIQHFDKTLAEHKNNVRYVENGKIKN